MQQRVLVGVLAQMQERILYTINEKEKRKSFPTLFPEEDTQEVMELDIDPRELGITPDHYGDLEDAMRGLSKLTIAFPKYSKGEVRYVIAPLFGRIEMPRGEVRRTGRMRVKMLRENIEDFFSLAHGYTVHLARITQICKKKRTPRLYIFLSSFREIGHKEVEYQVLLKFLGVDQQTFEQDNETMGRHVKENPFSKYNKVRSQILEPSKREMDEFLVSGDIDFSFQFEPLYKTGRLRGNPTHIRFNIIKGDLARERDVKMAYRRKMLAFVNTMCEWCNDLSMQKMLNLCARVPRVEVDGFLSFGYRNVRNAVEQKQPDNVADYTLKMLEKYISNCEQKTLIKAVREAEKKWDSCKADMIDRCTQERSQRVIASIGFVSWDEKGNNVVLRLNSMNDYEWISQDVVVSGLIKPILVKHFGEGVSWGYHVPR